jgi:DNA-binding transcriptional LysR family regulator
VFEVDLNEALLFVSVVETGSFRGTADALGIPKTTVSRKVSNLEERLGVRLLHRTTRNLALTDDGRAYYERVSQAVKTLVAAEQALEDRQAVPSGKLRISAPMTFAKSYLLDVIAEYAERWPRVSIELIGDHRIVDLVAQAIDVAIRIGPLSDSTLIAKTLGTAGRFFVASPSYLEKHGSPASTEDLELHSLIGQSGLDVPERWHACDAAGAPTMVPVTPRLAFNDYDMILDAAIRGLGIAFLPEFLVARALEARTLERILGQHTPSPAPLHAVYPSARNLAPRVRAFIDLLVERFTPPPWASHRG